MQNDELVRQIVRRLDILISLELERSPGGQTLPISGRIRRLAKLGLPASEIARIISKPVNYVTATLAQQKKATKKRAKKNE